MCLQEQYQALLGQLEEAQTQLHKELQASNNTRKRAEQAERELEELKECMESTAMTSDQTKQKSSKLEVLWEFYTIEFSNPAMIFANQYVVCSMKLVDLWEEMNTNLVLLADHKLPIFSSQMQLSELNEIIEEKENMAEIAKVEKEELSRENQVISMNCATIY